MSDKAMVRTGWVLSGLYILFMLGASVTPKFFFTPMAEENLAGLGWQPGNAVWIGVVELACVLLYAIPRTAVLGAILTMSLLGGAMATQIRVDSPLFTHQLFSIYLALFMWGGLWLRSPALRAVFPIVRTKD